MVYSSAFADWQFTRWGMTAEEIVAASSGRAQLIPEGDREGKSTSSYDAIALSKFFSGPFKFDVTFGARKGELTLDTVSLKLEDPTGYRQLRETLNAKYGPGREEKPRNKQVKITRTIWNSETDTIVLEHVDVVFLGEIIVYLIYTESLTSLDH